MPCMGQRSIYGLLLQSKSRSLTIQYKSPRKSYVDVSYPTETIKDREQEMWIPIEITCENINWFLQLSQDMSFPSLQTIKFILSIRF